MPEKLWYRQPSRIIVAGVAVALLIALSGSLVIARVRASHRAVTAAFEAHENADNSVRLLADFLTERDTAGQYLLGLQASGGVLAVVRGQHASFQATVAQLAAAIEGDNTPEVASQVTQIGRAS